MRTPICLIAAALIALSLAPVGSHAAAPGGTADSCSVSCTFGGGCSASGVAPCSCRCRGIFGFGGPLCSCGSLQMQDPVGG